MEEMTLEGLSGPRHPCKLAEQLAAQLAGEAAAETPRLPRRVY